MPSLLTARGALPVDCPWFVHTLGGVEPDLKGEQLKALLSYLYSNPRIKYVFYDLMSLPQGGDKLPAEKAEFFSGLGRQRSS